MTNSQIIDEALKDIELVRDMLEINIDKETRDKMRKLLSMALKDLKENL